MVATETNEPQGVHLNGDSSIGKIIAAAIESYLPGLQTINKKIHTNPELAYEEHQAHDTIVNFLQEQGFKVTPHAHGLATSFETEYGSGGRIVTFNAEYDALPGIGHACGHNLIATSSIASFLALASVLRKHHIPGRVRLLGTPAEEGGGGKLALISAGAFNDVDACLMVHPAPSGNASTSGRGMNYTGMAYATSSANVKLVITYTGKPTHAAMSPWQGVNALDAVVLAYNAISMLRQQMHPRDRVHGVIAAGGTRPNIITPTATLNYYVRSPNLKGVQALRERVENCFHGAATATGCSVTIEEQNTYYDLRPNKPLCSAYTSIMNDLQSPVICDFEEVDSFAGSTDQGNVSYVCPSFHGIFGIETDGGAFNHTEPFAAAAGEEEALRRCLVTARGMAETGWRVLSEEGFAQDVRGDFEEDRKSRGE